MVRIFLDIATKLKILEEAYSADRLIKPTAAKYGLCPSQIRKWKSNEVSLRQRAGKKTRHPGAKPKGEEFKELIFNMIEEANNKAHVITTTKLTSAILGKDSAFLAKEGEEQNTLKQRARIKSWINRTLESNGYSHRRPTHIAQNALVDVETVQNFVELVNSIVSIDNIPPSNVVNMDQTAIKFNEEPRKTITRKGAASVNLSVPKATGGTRASICIAAAADGTKLPCFCVFQGTENGTIKRKHVPNLNRANPNLFLATTQESAWCDQRVMMEWITKVWKPFVQNKQDQQFILLLDSHRVHKMKNVVKALENLRTRVEHLPPGTTSAAQVCDVGINKPFKDHVIQEIYEFVSNANNCVVGRNEMAQFITNAWISISNESIVSTFLHIGFNFARNQH